MPHHTRFSITGIAETDLEHILEHTSQLWDEVKGKSIFITGGTGFFGRWILESLVFANDRLDLGIKAVVLSRNPAAFSSKAPHLAGHPAVSVLEGDVRTFEFPGGEFSHIVHAATDSSVKLTRENSLEFFHTIVTGTRRTLDFARTHGTRKLLLVSSGAIYGKQPPGLTHLPEDYNGAPDPADFNSAYGEGKRAAEMLSCLYAGRFGFETKIARCFSFVGPFMPVDAHYAIGNFIRDACEGSQICISGDGTPYRSYLYAADLAIWLWTILLKGKSCRPYNVGSDRSISIAEIAKLVCASSSGDIGMKIAVKADPDCPPPRYVPSIKRAREELALDAWISVEKAIVKTLDWLQRQPSTPK